MNNIIYAFILLGITFILLSCEDTRSYPANGRMLSGGYKCISNGKSKIRSNNVFKPSIYANIERVSFDSNYIIAKQRPSIDQYRFSLAEDLMSYSTFLSRDSTQCKPEEYKFYQNFISKNRDLMKVIFKKLSPNHNSKDIDCSQIIADSLLRNDLFYESIFLHDVNYWIISHKELNSKDYVPMSKVYGPFQKQEYLRKREELAIPKDLILYEN